MLRRSDAGPWYRDEDGSVDLAIIRESEAMYAFKTHPILTEDDVVLDLGAHIGSAALIFLREGAKRVICVEPDAENFKVLVENLAQHRLQCLTAGHHGTALALHAAVGPPGVAGMTLYLHPKGHSAMHRTQPRRGRVGHLVESHSLEDLLEEHRPSVVKCDIEYGEYELPALRALPSHVRALHVELHGTMLYGGGPPPPKTRDDNDRMLSLYQSFLEQGFQPNFQKEKKARGSVYSICASLWR